MEINHAKSFGSIAKNFVLGVAIFILTLFVAMYGIKTIYEEPKYDDFCNQTLYQITTQSDCITSGGKWVEYAPVGEKIIASEGRCEAPAECYTQFDDANEIHSKKVFILAVPLAILIIALGTFVFHLNPVGVGMMFGGVGTLVYGAGGYWIYADNLFKFIISLVGLVVLIFLTYWFNKRFGKKN